MAEHPEIPREIVVEGYSQRFAKAVRHVLAVEGGFVDDPADRGGATKYGISLRFLKAEGQIDEDGDGFADFDLDFDGDIDGQDIRKLTRQDAVVLYHRCFWVRAQAASFPAPLGEMVFDQAVNGGLVAARKLLQRAINACLIEARGKSGAVGGVPGTLAVDGAIGPKTRAALAWVLKSRRFGVEALADYYRAAAKERYRDIVRRNPSQSRFLKGWLARADRMGRDA
jgi:lysozyme family protein